MLCSYQPPWQMWSLSLLMAGAVNFIQHMIKDHLWLSVLLFLPLLVLAFAFSPDSCGLCHMAQKAHFTWHLKHYFHRASKCLSQPIRWNVSFHSEKQNKLHIKGERAQQQARDVQVFAFQCAFRAKCHSFETIKTAEAEMCISLHCIK